MRTNGPLKIVMAAMAALACGWQSRTNKGADMNTTKVDASDVTGKLVIVCYEPKPGKDANLRDLLRDHVPILRRQGLATDRPAYLMKARNGAYLEVFEWKSQAAIDRAHSDPAVQKMWKDFGDSCEYRKLRDLAEANDLFAGFEPVDLDRAHPK